MSKTDRESGSASEPMPFAIDLLAGVEVLFTIGALAFLGIAALGRQAEGVNLPVLQDIYPRFLREPGPTALALLAGPPLLVAVGLFMRRPWGRFAAIALHVALGACALWHFALRLTKLRDYTSSSADLTIVMLFVFALSIGVPLFLRRPHMRSAFGRGHR